MTMQVQLTEAPAKGLSLVAVFQPIIDLYTGNPIGFEILARDKETLELPAELRRGSSSDRLWDIERACRMAAFLAISLFPDELRKATYFLNVSPDVLGDPRFREGFTLGLLQEFGLHQKQIVIEITEKNSIGDYTKFERLINHYVHQGFKVAIDDFGSGNSSLVTLISCLPQVIKVDMEVIRNIHQHPYKQILVRSLVSFAASVDSVLVTEGVESWDELEMLMRLGVRFAQGFLLAMPAPVPPQITPEFRHRLKTLVTRHCYRLSNLDEVINPLVIRRTAFERGTVPTEKLDEFFRGRPNLDHVVIVDGGAPVGLITRQQFNAKISGRYGYSLFQHKTIDHLANPSPLVVDDRIPITALAKQAMSRPPEELYDPVIVTDQHGQFLGTVTMKQLLIRSTELEVQLAQATNPLTSLPGNRLIEQWIRAAVENTSFSLIYADLDRFKEYNDSYGFVMGDDMIRLVAKILQAYLPAFGDNSRLGHIGGDDFVIVCPGIVGGQALEAICDAFDRAKVALFHDKDVREGSFTSVDRQGQTSRTPLTSLSLAVITSNCVDSGTPPAVIGQLAAGLKKKTKSLTLSLGRSAFLLERRNNRTAEASPAE